MRTQAARVAGEVEPGRLTLVQFEGGRAEWLNVGASKQGDEGTVTYVKTASSGFWKWAPNTKEQA